MTSESLQALLDAAVGALVTADCESVQDLGALCNSIEHMRDAASAAGYRHITRALSHTLELIKTMLLDAACDRADTVEQLNRIFSAIQHALRPGADPEVLMLPAGLLPDSASPDTAGPSVHEQPFVLPEYLDREIFNEFINDQDGVLASLENHLLKLDQGPDRATLADLRRIFHTLKGEAGVFELHQVERLCHDTEDLIDARPDTIPVDQLLLIKDWLKDFFDALKFGHTVPALPSDALNSARQAGTREQDTADNDVPETVSVQDDGATAFELSPYIDSALFSTFLADSINILQKIESLNQRFAAEADREAVAELKNIFLSLSSASGAFGLADIERLCHRVLDLIESDPALISSDGLFEIRVWLKSVFEALSANEQLPVLTESLLNQLCLSQSEYAEDQAADTFAQSDGPVFDDVIFEEFVDEQQSVADTIETLLLKLEKDPDSDCLDELKRVFHTLKGEATVFGLADIERLCHTVEDLFESCEHILQIDSLLSVKDYLARCFVALRKHTPLPAFPQQLAETLTLSAEKARGEITGAVVFNPLKGPVEFKVKSDADRQSPAPSAGSGPAEALNPLSADLDLLSDFVSEVKEHIDNIDNRLLSLENNPGDSDLLNAVFRVFHTIKGAAGFLALDEISRLAHITESLLDMARKDELILAGGSIDVVFEAVDEMKNLVGTIEQTISSGNTAYASSATVNAVVDKIKAIVDKQTSPLAASSRLDDAPVGMPPDTDPDAAVSDDHDHSTDGTQPADAETVCVNAQRTPLEIHAQPGTAAVVQLPETPDVILDEDDSNPTDAFPADERFTDIQPQSMQQRAKIKESIKVDSENLDKLIDAIGELVIIEAMIRQDGVVRSSASSTLLRNVTQMDKITRELQTLGMSLRMIPIKATFQKMARVVRDLARKSDKKIEFSTQGEETMLDKSVVDRIGDPLIHLVRNAVDHGIEKTRDDRRRAGKNPVGRIMLTAFHKGGNIYVEIRDDGYGLNREAIRKKAVERGLIREGQQLNDREINNLILLPGFSTARKVTDVSGRGVGMDVVKRTIEDLRGNIDITSEPGVGTIISLRLPLTLAIIDGMLVRIGNERYIIPTLSIVESIRPRVEDITNVINKGEMISIRDRLIPLFRLAKLFEIPEAQRRLEDSIVIVVEDSGRMTGIMVDELLGQQSTVIKTLGALKGLIGISGGSIMSDGSVGIILDIAGIVKLATGEKILD